MNEVTSTRRVVSPKTWACGAAGSALPWHGRGRLFDPDQVHQHLQIKMPSIYILRSQSSGRFYIGCAELPLLRLAEHQRGQTISTRGRGPWTLVYQESFDTLSQARQRERQLKSWKSHRSIQELIESAGERARHSREGRRFDPDQVHQHSRPRSNRLFNSSSLIRQLQIVQRDFVAFLPGITVHLEVDGHSIPSWARSLVEGPIEIGGLPIQSDRLIVL